MKVRLKTLLDKPRGGAWRSSARGVNCPVKSGKRSSDAMKQKLGREIYYIAGMQRAWKGSKHSVGICSSSEEIKQRFAEIAIKALGVKSEKIIVEGNCIFFYHSRIEKQLQRIIRNRTKIFSKPGESAYSYIAGIVDATGKITRNSIRLSLDTGDELVLERMGIHTKQGYVLNLSNFFMLIKPYSLLLSSIRTPGNERDPC